MAKKTVNGRLQSNLLNVVRLHFVYALLFAIQIIVYDAWKLITPEAVLERWIVAAMLFVVATVVWYLAHNKNIAAKFYRGLLLALILADIGVASFSVYTQRGMASKAVVLYVLPIMVSAVLASRAAILATAALCIAAYFTTAVSYFVLNFNEGYKIELYGEVIFYSAFFLLLASLMKVIISPKE